MRARESLRDAILWAVFRPARGQYLGALAEGLAGLPVLLVATYRPGYRVAWIDKSYATQIALRPLSPEDGLAVVRSVLGEAPAAEPVARAILDKAEGNPFFIEELSRALLDHPELGHVRAVPATIQDVLMARIDRLPEDAKRLLQTAAVLGREVPARLLSAVWGDALALEPALSELRRLEFLYELSGPAEAVHVFKHALTQEVAYESLLASRRQALHATVGRALETMYAGRLEEAYDRLAYHYGRAGDPEKAALYLSLVATSSYTTGHRVVPLHILQRRTTWGNSATGWTDLRIRGYSANTRECYLRCVRHFVRHFMRPPDQLTPEHIRQYQLRCDTPDLAGRNRRSQPHSSVGGTRATLARFARMEGRRQAR